MLEAYQAYGDYETMMELSETLVVECCRRRRPGDGPRPARRSSIPFRGRDLDLTPPFDRITILGSVSEATGEDDHARPRRTCPAVAERHDVPIDDAWGPGKIVQELFEKLVEEHDLAADVRVRLPARGLAAGPAAPRRSPA